MFLDSLGEPAPGRPYDPALEIGHRLAQAITRAASTRARTMELQEQTERVLAEAQAIQRIIADAQRQRRSTPDGRLRRSAYARLLARLDSMPVIEQAKGIVMAQSHCGEAEAFDMLRRASQRSNVPVRDLAARIVATAAGSALSGRTPPGLATHGRASGHADARLLPELDNLGESDARHDVRW